MNYARHSLRTATIALLLGFGLSLVLFSAHAQTNDPKIDQQDYLETINVPGAWNRTGSLTPAPMAIIGPGGVLSTHEDLLSVQVAAPPGAYEPDSLMPSTSTFAGGITHATSNNGKGIASISNRWGFGELYSYEAGTLKDFEGIPDAVYAFDMDKATTHTYDAFQNNGAEILLTPATVFENEDPSVTVSADLLANPIQVPRTDLEIPGFLGGILEGIGGWLYEEIVRNQKIADFNAAHTLAAKDGRFTVAPIGDFDGTETVWPASSSSSEIAFSVGGTTQEGTSRWTNSALSAVDDPDNGTLDIVAPAENVFSTLNFKQPGETKYGSRNSTVGSAAMAAGVASLLKGIAPNMVGDDLRQVLQRTADDIPPAGYDKQTGHGRLDAKDAVKYVQERSFTRGTVSNGSVTVVDDNLTTFTMLGGPWTSLASDKYDIEEKYKVEWTIDLPQGSDHDIWIRHPGTKGWSAANPATGHPWADIEIRSWESEATITTYGYQGHTYDNWGRIINTYGYPAKAEDAKVAYTIATKPGTPPPPPLEASISGPTYLNEGEQGTWTATASRDGASYTWFVDQGNGWYQIGSGPSVSWGQDYISSTMIVDIKVEASKNGETASAQMSVTINNNDGGGGGGGCNSVRLDRICLANSRGSFTLGNIRAEAWKNGTARVSWQTTSGSAVPSEFVIHHRADSTTSWSRLGTVSAGDSTSIDSSQTVTYHFRTDKLEIGTHQFRVGLPQNAGPAPRAVGNSETSASRRYTKPVTAKIEMDEAYRLSAYPNPVRQQATVELAVQERQNVQVHLYDVLGRRVATLHDGPLPAQELERLQVNVSATGLTSGTYFLRVTGETFATTEQVTVVR